MSELIHGWKDLMAYTGLPHRTLWSSSRIGGFRVLPRRRKTGSRVAFNKREVDMWFKSNYETLPPGSSE